MKDEEYWFTKIEAGYQHALIMDKENNIYSFGSGLLGQLGLGFDQNKARLPVPLKEINEGGNKATMIGCGSNISFALTELGLLFVWGMMVDGMPESVNYFPTLFSIPDECVLVSLKAHSRKVIACNTKGELYQCDLELRR